MSKQIIIMSAVVVVFVAMISGYIIYQNVTKELAENTGGKNSISILLEDIESVTELGLGNEQKIEFSWMVGQNKEIKEIVINGQQIEVKSILNTDVSKIKDYFDSNGFEQDEYNFANGTIAGLTGYKKDNIVCIVAAKICVEETSCFDKSDVSIKCGYLDNSSEPISFGNISKQELTIENGEVFSISLGANLTTGYQWQIDFDYVFVQFLDVKYTSPPTELIGSEGVEKFDFKAIKSGEASIIFSYLRPWEEKAPIKKVIYDLIIK